MIPVRLLLRLFPVKAEKRRHKVKILNLIGASALFAALAIAQKPSYTLTDLGPAGNMFSQANQVNNNGFVAGLAMLPGGAEHSYMWYEGIYADIGGLGGTNSAAGGVNNLGQVMGGAETTAKDLNNENFCGYGTGLQCLVYKWQNGIVTALPTLGGTNANWGGINNAGEIAGVAETGVRDPKCPAVVASNGTGPQVLDYEPVIWGPGPDEIRQLPLPSGDTVGYAFAINDNGQAVGMTGTCATTTLPGPAASRHAVLWENGAITDLGNLGGTYNPAALGVGNVALNVNNKGQVVGSSAIRGSAHNHAFLWSREAGMQDLGTLPGDVMSAGFFINNRGEVVGASLAAPGPPTGTPRPFLWINGRMLDLTTLVPANSPLQLLPASSINDRGEISGFGVTSNGEVHAYLLTPVKTSSD
jgi:probable HAF family extracellular repeat protein